MDVQAIEKTFEAFMSSKFGIILVLALLILLVIVVVIFKNWSKISPFLTKLIDAADSTSTMRALTIFNTIFSNVLFWGVWAVMTICDNMDNTVMDLFTIPDIPSGVVTAYLGINGVTLAGKAVQSFAESKTPPATQPPAESEQSKEV